MPMAARAKQIEQKDKVRMTYDDIKKLYKHKKLKTLKLRPPKGAGTKAPVEQQRRWLRSLKAEITKYKRKGYVIIQIDESTFQPNKHQQRDWAPVGKPITKPCRYF